MTRRGLRADAWVALAIAAVSVFLLAHMWRNPAGSPIFGVSADTLPEAMAITLAIVSVLLAIQSWMGIRRAPAPAPEEPIPGEGEGAGRRGPLRFAALFAICIAFIVALPWFGFLLSGAALVAASALLLGNRRWALILAITILSPLLLAQFFEKAMVIYLPAGRLFQ